jgi:DNA-binding response OmpR family regulator
MKTALIVEDSQTDQNFFRSHLQKAGFSVSAVSSVEEAEDKVKASKPDLIILDVILPGQSGFELCRELKSQDETKSIPIIICSTKETNVDKMWGDMLGANAYLVKPVDPEEFVNTAKKFAG